ncbi:MAG: permease [Gemmatimonadetes bacterium]|nr:permease [Gemmatimonadota bacterium]
MSFVTLWRRIRHFLRRDIASSDLQEEMRMHLELRAEQLQRAGATAADAQHEAHRQFGNSTIVAEDARAASGLPSLEHAMNDLRLAVRRLRQRPGFAVSVIGVMALGIGATTAMFSAVDAAMLRPLPFAHPSELVWLRDIAVPSDEGGGAQPGAFHMLDVHDVERMSELFSASATYAAGGLNVSDDDNPVRVNAGVVTVGFFATLGVLPARGRNFSVDEGRPGAAKVAIISSRFWRAHFGERDISNLSVSLNGQRHRIVGIMPDGFTFPRESDIWIPMSMPTTAETYAAFRGYLPSETIARLAPGVFIATASAQLRARWQRTLFAPNGEPLRDENAATELADIRMQGALLPFQERLVGDKRKPLLILLGATVLLLLIACANVANLLLSQGSIRRREMALRAVLGATRGRLIAQVLVESVVLAIMGAVLGIALAPVVLGLVGRLLPPVLADAAPARLDLRVLSFAVLLALVAGIVFGLWPALGNSRNASDDIKAGGGHGATAGRLGRGRRILIATELALTIVLLVAAGLMQRSFEHLMGLDRGMRVDHVATLELSFKSMPQSVRMQILNDILFRISAAPGMSAAGAVNDLPLRGGGAMAISIETYGAKNGTTMARYLTATAGYFDALGIRILEGRTFAASDDSLAPRVVMVSESMAKQVWPGRNAIGETFKSFEKPVTVIGIVADVREASLDMDPLPQMYFPIAQQTPANVAIVARSTLPSNALLPLLTAAVRSVDRTQAVYNVRMMKDVVGASVTPRRTNTLLISLFAGIALVLSALGVYAVVAYGVAQRARELGIRAALGARSSNLVSLVMGELAWSAIVGIATGLGGAWALSKVVEAMLYGVSPHDPVTYALVPLALIIPGGLAAVVPAYRAAQVDPTIVLRTE